MERDEILVLGAGVIGMAAAVRLAESGRRVRVRHDGRRPVSEAATAMVGPDFAPPGSDETRWYTATVRELGRPAPGVHPCRGLLVTRESGQTPPMAVDLPGYAPADSVPDGFAEGFWTTLPLVDMIPYLGHLRERLADLGVPVEVDPVRSLEEAVGQADAVVNATGLAAGDLAHDEDVRPVRGLKVVCDNPGLDTFFMEAPLSSSWVALHPHGDTVVLGGDAVEHDGDPELRAGEVEELVARCAAVVPEIRRSAVREAWVGLRPGRARPRVERIELDGTPVIHDYGHGGVGMMYAWGCADDVVDLLDRA